MRSLQLAEDRGQRPASRPAEGSDVFIAIDLSRNKWVYAVRWEGEQRRSLSTPGEWKHVEALLREYSDCRLHLTYEACGFGYEVAWRAREMGAEVTVIAPSRMERIPGRKVKTDQIDVAQMARKLEQGTLKSIYIPSREIHEYRQLATTYEQAVKDVRRNQARIRALAQEHGRIGPTPRQGWKAYAQWLDLQTWNDAVRDSLLMLRSMRELAANNAKVMRRALLEVAASDRMRPIVRALVGEDGVGELSAIRFVLHVGEITRFARRGSLPNYVGLTPSEYSSGESVCRGPILKCGPGSLRVTLVQCAWAAVRNQDAELRKVFERLAPRTGKRRAIVAVARRLAMRLRARWIAALQSPQTAA